MKSRLLSVLIICLFSGRVAAQTSLTCEHFLNPVGIGTPQPRLSWKVVTAKQSAYQVRAASSPAILNSGQGDLWDSGKVASDDSVLIPWGGKPLASRSRVYWQVRAWDANGAPSAWSEAASFELGLLSAATEFKGQWLVSGLPRFIAVKPEFSAASWISASPAPGATAAFRHVIEIPANVAVRSAVADISAEGGFTFYVNGNAARRSGTRPGAWKQPTRADFGAALTAGKNILAIAAPATGNNGVIGHIQIELDNGAKIDLNTDVSWKSSGAPPQGWQTPAFDDRKWTAATVLGAYSATPWGDFITNNTTGPGRYFRKTFTAKGPIARATLYATALGVYEASINGRRVSDTLLEPGWTDYTKRVMVQTTDVTGLVSTGSNTIGAILADGWYAGRLGWMGLAQYADHPAFAAQLEITYADGTTQTVATDTTWKSGAGEIVASDQQWGEVIDARKSTPDWDRPSFNDAAWSNAGVEPHKIQLDPQRGPPIGKLMELAPQTITAQGAVWIVDFGQNMVGHVRLSAAGPAGTTITVRHGEMRNPDGTLYVANLRPARATDTFILSGAGAPETFEPHFTFHGFRYVEVSGYPGELSRDDIKGIVVGSKLPASGTFECSEERINRLYQNILWGQRGNFLSVPTDCPQRDERMGWMGDAQVFAPTAARNNDVAAFFNKWMVDVDDGQSPRGDYSDVSPRIARPQPGWPVWGDAGVIIPWTMYVNYADQAFLSDNYPYMARWIDYGVRTSPDLIRGGGVGDHLAPVRTPIELVDTAYFANSANILAKSAAILGKTGDAIKYNHLHNQIVAAFNKAFVSPNGILSGDTQTAYILALQFDLLPEKLRAAAARRLAQNVRENGHLTTGFVGVGLICPALTQIGRSDLAYQLLFTDTYPSWLFSIKNGATTIWERWDGWTPEKGFQDPAMNSFNHYSLGSVGQWLYSGAAGIQLDESHPGYKHFFLKPQFTNHLTFVKASVDSPYGLISSHWHVQGDQLLYDITIPPNTSADLSLPVPPQNVLESGHRIAPAAAIATDLPLAAGTYHFSFPLQLMK